MNRTKFILITDRVPPAKDNIGAYTCHLSASLQDLGQDVEVWSLQSLASETMSVPFRSFAQSRHNIVKLCSLVRVLRDTSADSCIILWQYNPFLYGWKGLPSLLSLLPIVLKVTTRCRVGIVFHEICYTPNRDPRSWAWALFQRVALWMSLVACDVAIATTQPRRLFLQRFARLCLPRSVNSISYATVPVGSNIGGYQARSRKERSAIVRIGTFATSLTRQNVALLHELCHHLTQSGLSFQLLLIGGGASGRPEQCSRIGDDRRGIVESGYLSADDLSVTLSHLDIFIGLFPDGASGRRTSLAAAFAHGLCIVATDGPNTDHTVFRDGDNCLLIPRSSAAHLCETVRRLIGDTRLRDRLAGSALETYQREMAWPVIARKVLEASIVLQRYLSP